MVIPVELRHDCNMSELFAAQVQLMGTLNAKPWQEHAAESMLFHGIAWSKGNPFAEIHISPPSGQHWEYCKRHGIKLYAATDWDVLSKFILPALSDIAEPVACSPPASGG